MILTQKKKLESPRANDDIFVEHRSTHTPCIVCPVCGRTAEATVEQNKTGQSMREDTLTALLSHVSALGCLGRIRG